MSTKGKRLRTEHLELRVLASPLSHPRVGFVVPKHGRSAVERNRLKRRLREIARLRLLGFLPPADLIVRAKPGAYAASYAALDAELLGVRDRISRALA